jgi:hypothetical protein
VAFRATRWLHFAAAPTFAAMALATSIAGSGMGASSLDGMTTMYVLMSVFHCAPWLRLAAARRSRARAYPSR